MGLALLLAASLSLVACRMSAAAPGRARPPRPAPAFTLTDAGGHARALAGFRGRPVVLLLFCGCDPCHRCASIWGQVQGSGTLGQDAGRAGPPSTVVVYQGDAEAARAFAAETGLDAGTVLLMDPQDRVAGLYHAPVCPRVFVLDARGILRYTNDEPGTDPSRTPAAAIVSSTVTALRLIRAPTAPAVPRQKHPPKEAIPHG